MSNFAFWPWRARWNDPSGKHKLNDLFKDPLFWIVAVIKLAAGSLFASTYFSYFFQPFLEHFAEYPLQDPYEYAWLHHEVRSFPYPAFMLYVLDALRICLTPLGATTWPLAFKFLIFRIPIFISDLAILCVFIRWLHPRGHRVILLYWGSPVLFYISYVHGQLDAIPIALLFISLYFLFRERLRYSALFLGFGLASKTHLIMALPFFLLYIWRHRASVTPVFLYTLVTALAFLVPNLPFIFNKSFQEMVFYNVEQNKIAAAWLSFSYDGPHIYIIPAAYMLLICYASRITIQNRDVFAMFLGFSFGVLLLFISPMQGWYFWIIPFIAYFCTKASSAQSVLFYLLQISYLFYFAVSPSSDYFQILGTLIPAFAQHQNFYQQLSAGGEGARAIYDIAFTAMQTLLVANCAWIYQGALKGLQNNKLSSRTFLIGIAGDSGSGKSVLSRNLLQLFTPRYLVSLCGDDMHKWQRGHAKWKEYTHLNPKGNELHQELAYITAIRQNATIRRRHYDHDTGQFTDEVAIPPKPLMVLEGLHAFFLKPARDKIDLKIFMRPDDQLLLHWKLQRDMAKRGYSMEQVLASVQARQADAESYVKVQANVADIVFAFRPGCEFGALLGDAGYEPEVRLTIRMSNRFCLDPLVAGLAEAEIVPVEHYYLDENWQILEFAHFLPLDVLEKIGEKYVPGFQDFGLYAPAWCNGWDGVLQLVVAYCIFHDSTRFPEF